MSKYSVPKINRLLRDGDNAATSKEKGDKLEELVCYLFSKLKGVRTGPRNAVDIRVTEEIDIMFWNKTASSDIPFLDYILIVECKNWSGRVDAQVFRDFTHRLRTKRRKHGILVAAGGVTGNPEELNAANGVIRDSYRDGIEILVVTRDEIELLVSTEDLVELLEDKLMALTATGTSIL